MKNIWRVFKYLRYYPKEIFLNIFFNIFAILFNLGSFILIIPFAELLFGMTPPPTSQPAFAFNQADLMAWLLWHLYILKNDLGVWLCLLVVAAGYLACNLLSNACRYLGLYFLSPIRNGIIQRLRNEIYHHITILPIGYFTVQRRGDILSRLSNDLFDIEWSIVSTMQSLVKDPINILVFAGTLVFISPKLFGLFLLILPPAVFLISKIAQSLKRNSIKGQTKLGALFAELEENLNGIRTITAFGKEEARQQHFTNSNADITRTNIRITRRRELSSPLSEVLGTIGLMAILIIGGDMVLGGEMASSVFIFFVIIFARLIPPVQAIVKAYNSLVKGSAAAGRIFELLDAEERIVESPHATLLQGFANEIEYRNVSFAYDGVDGAERYVLKNIQLTIPKGHTVAIVGPSGAGKTTLVDLLPRFYDCTQGGIWIDGQPIERANIGSLRALFGIVSQNSMLFNDTIANNITLGAFGISRQQIEDAARMAYAHDFISRLPKGYDTLAGDLGAALSGGQRQRICIARALLRKAPVLILDEATSALDNESELAIQQALAEMHGVCTCIIIAHRLSTIRHADEIVVMNEGSIVQKGTHQELLLQGGIYKTMVEEQHFL